MNLRVFNIISGVLFFISSSSLLIIPFLDFDDNLSVSAYAVALLFWGGSISGIIIQIILFVTCKKYTKVKESKTRQIVGVIFLISVFVLIPILLHCPSEWCAVIVFLTENCIAQVKV